MSTMHDALERDGIPEPEHPDFESIEAADAFMTEMMGPSAPPLLANHLSGIMETALDLSRKRLFSYPSSMRRVSTIVGEYGTGCLPALCLGFTNIIGRTNPDRQARFLTLIDEYAFPQGKRNTTMLIRYETRAIADHDLRHGIDWLKLHEKKKVLAVAYLVDAITRGNDNGLSHCAVGIVSSLGFLAGWTTRPRWANCLTTLINTPVDNHAD